MCHPAADRLSGPAGANYVLRTPSADYSPTGGSKPSWNLCKREPNPFSRQLQFLNAVARSDEHVPGFHKVRFAAERAVPRNDLGVIVRERKNFVGGGKHAGDRAAVPGRCRATCR
jgi:hypothetical protein